MNHPAINLRNGDFIAVDLDANNDHARKRWAERHGREPSSFGWGVCRHGHGLQHFGDGFMSERVARARATVLSEGRPATDVPNVEPA